VNENPEGEFSFMRFLCKKLVMQWIVLSGNELKEELLEQGINEEVDLVWIKTVDEIARYPLADGYVDLLFDNTNQRIELLKNISLKPVIINSVVDTLKEIDDSFIRINAWPGFLKRSLVEASYKKEENKQQAEHFFSSLNKKIEWITDQPGFITARVIAAIINEAYFALGEGVSTREEIDIAMKLGTNYPYGPFEWCRRIGKKNIYLLLNKLGKNNPRYTPAPLLKKEALV